MKIDKKMLEDHQMQLTVVVDSERMEASKRRAARQLARRGKIPGFRPGKAPYDVIVRHYGEAAVVEQAMDNLVDEIYPQVLDEAGINPAAAGVLDKIEELDPPKLIFTVPLAPEVDLGDYHSVRLKYKWSAPGKKELGKALTELRQMYATTETVERPAEIDDYVLVDVKGERERPEDGEDHSAALSRNGYALVIRAEPGDDEWPYPGFSKELVGLKPDENKTIKHRYPKDDADESMRGETVAFDVRMKTVQSMTLPELDDEFVKTVGQYETLDELKEALQKDLEARSKAEYDDAYYTELIDKIKENATIKYPPQVVEHEAEHVMEDMNSRLSQQGLDLDTYLKMRQTTREQFMKEEAKPVAVKRLERSLIMDQLATDEKIEIEDSAVQEEFGQTLTELQYQGLDLSKVKGGKQGQQQVAEAVARESAMRLITRKTLERMKAIATGELKQEKPETGGAAGKKKKTKAGAKAGKTGAGTKSGKSAAKKKTSPKKTTKAATAKSSGSKSTSPAARKTTGKAKKSK